MIELIAAGRIWNFYVSCMRSGARIRFLFGYTEYDETKCVLSGMDCHSMHRTVTFRA